MVPDCSRRSPLSLAAVTAWSGGMSSRESDPNETLLKIRQLSSSWSPTTRNAVRLKKRKGKKSRNCTRNHKKERCCPEPSSWPAGPAVGTVPPGHPGFIFRPCWKGNRGELQRVPQTQLEGSSRKRPGVGVGVWGPLYGESCAETEQEGALREVQRLSPQRLWAVNG